MARLAAHPEGSVGVVGHNFQAAWALLRIAQRKFTFDADRNEGLTASALTILEAMKRNGAINTKYGGST